MPVSSPAASGYGTDALIEHILTGGPAASSALFTAKSGLADTIDSLRRPGSRAVLPISHPPDELRRVETGYGDAQHPEDYLESFGVWLRDDDATHHEDLPAPEVLMPGALENLRDAMDELQDQER